MKCPNCNQNYHVRIYEDGTTFCDHCDYEYDALDKLIVAIEEYKYNKNKEI